MTDPFQGETATCIICGAVLVSDPAEGSGWRCLVSEAGEKYYFCPAEFPPEAKSIQAVGVSYFKVLAVVLGRRGNNENLDDKEI